MSRTVIVGLDGSPQSGAAADWAAREALRRPATLDLVQIRDTAPYPYTRILDARVERDWAERITRETEQDLARRYPDLITTRKLLTGQPADVMVELTSGSELVVLGSRALGPVLGFLVGSVALPTVAHTRCPVVLVRAGDTGPAGRPVATNPSGDVVLGAQLDPPAEEVVAFAFETAMHWSTGLRVVHGWNLPPVFGVRSAPALPRTIAEVDAEREERLTSMLRPWREKFPGVAVECRVSVGGPAGHLLDAASGASLVVVGRRTRRSRLGAHIGPVTHAVMHHCEVPVAVVPHD